MSGAWKPTSVIERSKRRQALRLLIQGEEILRFVLETADQLAAFGNAEKSVSSAKVGALKAAAEIKLRVLDKVLPDLKSIEHEMGEGLLQMRDDELHERIRSLTARLAAAGLLEGGALRISAVALRGSETIN